MSNCSERIEVLFTREIAVAKEFALITIRDNIQRLSNYADLQVSISEARLHHKKTGE
jgi:hypothetical protein